MNTLHVRETNSILIAGINRSEALNAVDFEVMEELEKTLSRIETTGPWHAFILQGEGGQYFASGGDLKKFAGLKSRKDGLLMARRMEAILERIEKLTCWTIAAVNGDAYGGGCEILLAFDFIVSSEKSRFGFTQRRFNLPPGWGGLTRLVERVGRSTALEWLGGSVVVDASKAFQKGLLNHTFPVENFDRHMLDWAGQLADMDPDLIRSLKEGCRYALNHDRMISIKEEQERFGDFWAGDRHHRLVSSFLNKKNTSS